MTAAVTTESVVRNGPGTPDWPWAHWLRASGPLLISVGSGFDTAWERTSLAEAHRLKLSLLSIRISGREVQIGPLRPAEGSDGDAGGLGGCAGCAWVRERWTWLASREAEDLGNGSGPAADGGYPAMLAGVVQSCAGALSVAPLAPGELVTVNDRGIVRRHRVRRSLRCQVCGPAPADRAPAAGKPEPLRLSPRPTTARIPVRTTPGPFNLDVDVMRAELTDARFGPITKVLRDRRMPFALTEISVAGGAPPGYGRSNTFRDAEMIGYFEALERYAGYPHTAPMIRGVSYRQLAEPAIDLASLGHYAPQQYSASQARVRPYDGDTPMDWTWALPLRGTEPVLVPADVAFYQYQYPVADTGPVTARNYFHESSSGCALGGNLEEAALHSLLELAERDAFQLAWHRARPLPELDPDDITDPESRMLMSQIRQAGYDVHLLVATADIPIPVVWALLIHRDRILPASFSSAGSDPDPELAVRSALWEVSQLAIGGLNWDPTEHVASIADPWRVNTLLDHIRRNAFPELLPRLEAVLGGPKLTRAEAFPGWPQVLTEAAAGDVTGALRTVADLFAGAGLDTVLVVDQSTPEHRELGVHAARCIVPGIVPMNFGHPSQRLLGLPRLLGELPVPDDFGFDPHPFP